MFYDIIDNKLLRWGNFRFNSNSKELQNVTMEEYNNEPYKYILKDGELILNPEYKSIKEQKEKEHISKLRCTKRVFALCLKEFGISYSQLKEVIASDEDAQLEWDLCVELERCNSMIDTMASKLGITSKQLDLLFRYANGELESLEV